VEETEVSCPHGRSYFEALAHALVVSMLVRWHERRPPLKGNVPAVRWGIREAIGRLESDFSERISVSELARTAKLSVDYFGAAFRRATGTTPHQYLLRVRLNRARAMMTQKPRPRALAEIALACGFADQTHFCRHFRRFMGMTPTEFLQSQNTGARQYPCCGGLGQLP
jgi:AraC family transcriptional regulator